MTYLKLLTVLGVVSTLSGCVEVGVGSDDGTDDTEGSGPSVSGGFGIDSEGNVEGNVEVELGVLNTATAATDAASLSLAPVASVRLLGYAASADFHRGEPIEVSLLPLDASGHGIIDADVYVGASVTCEVGFGMSGSVAIQGAYAPESREPYQFGIGMDGSGSMELTDPSRQRVPAGQTFVDTIARSYPSSQFSLVEFDDVVVEHSALTGNLDVIKAAMAGVTSDGNTRLHDATLKLVEDLAATNHVGFQQAVLLLSDGMDTASDHDASAPIAAARAAGIPIHAISLGGALDVPGLEYTEDLQRYAYETGGLFVHVRNAAALAQTFENLALATAEGQLVLDVRLSGGLYLPFSTCTVSLDVHSGGSAAQTSFDLVMPIR